MKIRGIVILLLIGLAACQPKVEIPEFTNSEAVYIKLEKKFILHPDGSFEKHVSKTQKLLTHRSFHGLYGQTNIYYNPEMDSVVIVKAQTLTPDGKIVEVPENGYVDMIPSFATGSSQFSHLRHKVIVHTALERGAIIESDYIVYSKPGSIPGIKGHEIITNDCPVIDYKLIVQVPKDQAVNFNSINIDANPKIRKKGKYLVYTWEVKNIDQSSAEPFGTKFNAEKKQILFSSADSLFTVFNTFTSQRAFTFETNADMRKRVNETLKGKTNTFEKIAALQKIVSEEIQTIPVPLYLTDYKIRAASETWESMSGTAEEKAVLLCALIRSTGWNASPVAVVPEYLFEKDSSINLIGNMDLLKFNLVKFPVSGQDYFISADRYQLLDISSSFPDHLFIPLEMGYSKINLIKLPTKEFQLSWDGELRLINNKDLVGEFDGTFMGPANPHLGLKMRPDAIHSLSSGKESIEWIKPISTVVSFEKEIKDAAVEFGDKIQIQIPYSKLGFSSLGIKHLSQNREGEFVLPYPIREFQRVTITVPENFKVIDVLVDYSLKNDVGRVSIRHSYEFGKISCMRNILITKTSIQVEDYQKFKDLIDPWLNPNYQRVILENSK